MLARSLCVIALSAVAFPLHAQDWSAKEAPIMTRWAKEVSPENVLPEYPRPQMVREKWQNLNGLWDYAIETKAEQKPGDWDGKILVPFAAESALSGVMKRVGDENKLWYRRTFSIPQDWQEQNVLLHFGAADWQTTVWVNGKEVGKHEGGYDPFSFDITSALKKDGGEQEIVVGVWDPTEKGTQPRGKQLSNPHGIWYTPVTGIWQTVWIEPVPKTHIASLAITPDFEAGSVKVAVNGAEGAQVRVNVPHVSIGDRQLRMRAAEGPVEGKAGEPVSVKLLSAQAWTPDRPNLYGLTVELHPGRQGC